MKYKINLGVVCLARNTFDYNAAKKIYDGIKEDLKRLENVNIISIDNMLFEVPETREAAIKLSNSEIDGLVVISGTFHLGHLILELDKAIKKPILLWGLKELAYNGGKIRLNSVCGVNLNASNLYKSGNKSYHAIISDSIDEDWVDAIRIKSAIEKSRVGIAGYRAHGFFNLDIDELKTFQKLGVLIDHYELSEIFNLNYQNNEINENNFKNIFDVTGITDGQLDKVSNLAGNLKTFMDQKGLNGLAVRCWPEFAKQYGIAPCAAMSYLQSMDYILGCEGDVEGTISMIAHKATGAETPFLADLSQTDLENDFALMWHCGAAPCNLWDGKSNRSLDTYFAGGKGVTADFVMKSGEVTIVRIDSVGGKYRIFIEKGEAIQMDKLLKGTYAKVKFDHHIKDVLEKVIYSGVAHHVSLAYGDQTKAFEMFAKIMNIEVIKL